LYNEIKVEKERKKWVELKEWWECIKGLPHQFPHQNGIEQRFGQKRTHDFVVDPYGILGWENKTCICLHVGSMLRCLTLSNATLISICLRVGTKNRGKMKGLERTWEMENGKSEKVNGETNLKPTNVKTFPIVTKVVLHFFRIYSHIADVKCIFCTSEQSSQRN